MHYTVGFVPQPGDYFNYHEVESVGNGTGTYAGYTDQTVVTGGERMDGVVGNTVSANYSYSYNYSNNQGNSSSGSQSGDYTFSSTSFLYVNGTDDQVGYVNPTVWFAMNNSLPVGGTFSLLNTQMTIISKNYTFYLPTEGKYVSTIFAQGNGTYYGSPDNDAYGMFNAKYTWNEYFDPSTGYVVGYSYVEQDSNSSGTSFTYTDDLYVTQTSYPLTIVAVSPVTFASSSASLTTIAVTSTSASSGLGQYTDYIIGAVVVIVLIAILAYALSRRSKTSLPKHSAEPEASTGDQGPPPPSGPPQDVDLIPKEQPPVQQIVIKEVAKVKCSFCGAMIDSTAQVCPRCGAPRS